MTTVSGQTLMLVRIYTSDGILGLGDGTTIGGLAEAERFLI
jgi:muconate cycloisomerase